MKKETRQKHINIANNIMYYIYTHIATHIDIDELSIELGVSKFHLHRIFKETFDKNIYESIKSIRLQKASNLLLTNQYSTVSNIANLCGYSSQSSFIKAFKMRFKMTPTAWKKGGYKEYSRSILKQSEQTLQSRVDFHALSPEIVKLPEIESYYIRHKGYDSSIKQTWQKLQTWAMHNEVTNYEQLALFHDNPTVTPLQECQYIACIVVDPSQTISSDRLPKFKISDGIYAKFHLKGKEGDILMFIHWLYHEWLPKSEYETTTKPSYVRYQKNNYLSTDAEFELDFYISIRF